MKMHVLIYTNIAFEHNANVKEMKTLPNRAELLPFDRVLCLDDTLASSYKLQLILPTLFRLYKRNLCL